MYILWNHVVWAVSHHTLTTYLGHVLLKSHRPLKGTFVSFISVTVPGVFNLFEILYSAFET